MSNQSTGMSPSENGTEPDSINRESNASSGSGIPFRERLIAVERATNPLREAAWPLLRALAEMPNHLDAGETFVLHDLLTQEVRTFQKLCEQANVRRDHVIGARYCLCTALDEAAGRTEWGKEGSFGIQWIKAGLATTFHEDRDGGDKVYLLIARLLNEPGEHLPLLEVIYEMLSLGFEGRYRHETNGTRKHEVIRQRLYNEITMRRGSAPAKLSPHWQSDAKGKRLSFHDFPVWISVAFLSVILLAIFGWFKYELMSRSASVQKQIAEIGRMTPPPAPPKLHLKQLLKDEIAAGTVGVDEDARHSAVTFRGDAMFQPGSVAIKSSIAPLVAKIASEIVKVPGKVTVFGYTDNVPIRSRQFPSNEALSEERATQVMQMLQSAGVPPGRLEAVGKGDADPIGDNGTAQGRAQNRRVEIVVAQ